MTRFRPREIEIRPDDPDPFSKCKLGRKPAAEMLTRLIENSETGLTIGLNAAWGDGKTTFLRMWRQHLVNEGYPTLLFSAWEHDFSDDALVALIGELEAGIDGFGLEGERETRAQAAFAEVKRVGVLLLKHAIPIGLRLLTGGVLRLDEDLEYSLGTLAETVAKERLEAYEASRNHFLEFKEKLARFAALIAEEKVIAAREARPSQAAAIQRRPLVIFVDELDRCRPTFAIEVLEKIKHLFDVEGVVFVLAVDREQLGKSIKAIYGNIYVDRYLRRFFDVDFRLPPKDYEKICEHLLAQYDIENSLKAINGVHPGVETDAVKSIYAIIQQMFDFKFRDSERVFFLLLLYVSNSVEGIQPMSLVLFLISLKIAKPGLYARLSERSITSEEFVAELQKHKLWSLLKSTMHGDIISIFSRTVDGDEAKYKRILNSAIERLKRQPGSRADEERLNYLQNTGPKYAPKQLASILERIDLAADLTR